jgi:hypothetical protein
MNPSPTVRGAVRQRAGFACEFCGVTEDDAGGELVIDHYQPRARGGPNDLDNLLYCCFRCNLYKADYWPATADAPPLWNPRREPRSAHMVELADGTLGPLTRTGIFTVQRLRLNRPPLIAHRRRKRDEADAQRLLEHSLDIARVLVRLQEVQAALLAEQSRLLDEQRALLRALLERQPPSPADAPE